MALTNDLMLYAQDLENQYGLPKGFLTTQAQAESGGDPNARNGNAAGLMQFMPATASEYNVDVTDPYSSLNGAAAYDANLYQQTGSWVDVLKKYGTTSGNALDTNTAAQNVNQIAMEADKGNPTPAGTAASGSSTTPGGGAGGSGPGAKYITWMNIEKYNIIAIILGVILIVIGFVKWGGGNVVNVMLEAGA